MKTEPLELIFGKIYQVTCFGAGIIFRFSNKDSGIISYSSYVQSTEQSRSFGIDGYSSNFVAEDIRPATKDEQALLREFEYRHSKKKQLLPMVPGTIYHIDFGGVQLIARYKESDTTHHYFHSLIHIWGEFEEFRRETYCVKSGIESIRRATREEADKLSFQEITNCVQPKPENTMEPQPFTHEDLIDMGYTFNPLEKRYRSLLYKHHTEESDKTLIMEYNPDKNKFVLIIEKIKDVYMHRPEPKVYNLIDIDLNINSREDHDRIKKMLILPIK